ncbi:MAG: hypothetical protein HFE77_03985 [Clostridiales bacterium]|nr:hypothetical protein [Clostridiales bacterium]
MNFMSAYKHLDNLCKDMNGIGITGYIKDMEQITTGSYYVKSWNSDYQQLKHYRHIRNQIAHETYANEENMCSDEDIEWLEDFYQRIINQNDPLALYYKATRQHITNKSTQAKPSQTTKYTFSYDYPSNTSRKPVGCAAMIFVATAVLISLINFLHF